jgi:tRNA(Ile2) C34 agmatinyltransferase TiaS
VSDFSDRVRRDGDGGPLTDVREVLDDAKPRCPWCEDEFDAKGECSRRCRASRVQREG